MRVVGVRNGPSRVEVVETEDGSVLRLRLGATVDHAMVETLARLLEWADLDSRPPLTYAEAAEALSVSTRTLRRKVTENPAFPHVRMGGMVRFLPEQIRQIKAEGWHT
jgi:excisionase family DNA binding protein